MPRNTLYFVRPTLEYAQDLRIINRIDIRSSDYQLFFPDRFILGHFKRENQDFIPDITHIFVEQSPAVLREYLFALRNEQLDIIQVGNKAEFESSFVQYRHCYQNIKGKHLALQW